MLNISNATFAQENCYSIIFRAKTELSKPLGNTFSTMNGDLNRILSNYEVTSFVQARPDGKTQKVRDLYELKISNSALLRSLYNELNLLDQIDDLIILCDVPSLGNQDLDVGGFNDPLVQGNDAWYLNGMNIPCSWDYSTGDNTVIAVVDEYFDYSHDDLANKFHSIQYFSNNSNPTCSHGFAVAGAAAAIINNGICTVGSGFNTKVAGYIVGSNSCGYVNGSARRQAILQAVADGHKIINISSAYVYSDLSSAEWDEIIDSGVVIVNGAFGNSNPFGSKDGYIYVAQADANINHVDQGYGTQSGSDIYALCVGVNRLQAQNSCGRGTGNTSFGGPTVAGIVALMQSANPCLSPQDIDKLLRQTQGQLPGNAPAGNTAGIMDACAAVRAAQNGLDYIVSQNTTIDVVKSVSGDLIIESGVTLTVTGTLKLAKKLIVRKRAHLIINGGTLTRNCGQWIGVVVEGNGAAQSGAGKVTMSNGAIIEGAGTGISMNPAHIPWPALASSWGGLVTASNSTIRDCRRAVEFMQMDSDNSSFTGCTFANIVNDGITLWDNDNVVFSGCSFSSIGRSAILAFDSRIDAYSNTFTSAKNGVEVVSTTSASNSSYLLSNTFSDNQQGIYAMTQTGAKELRIHGNNFYGGEHAITLAGLSDYDITTNTSIGSGFGARFWGTGNPGFVTQNNFTSSDWGTLANYTNETEYLNNCFRYNGKDIEVNTGSIYFRQGNPDEAASNCFSRGGAPDITAFSNVSFEYYYKPNDPNCRIPLNNGNYVKAVASAEYINNCEVYTGPPIIYRKCLIPFGTVATNKMIAEIEAEITKLLANTEMDPLLKAYLIKRYRACLAKVKKEKVVIIGKESEGITKEQAARDAATYAKAQEELDVKMLGFTMLTDVALYTDAQLYLNTFGDNSSDAADFVAIQNINLQYMNNRGNFVLSNNTKEAIRSLGDKTTPISGFARSLYYKLTGEKMPITFIYGGGESEIRTKKDVLGEELIKIYPNPANELLNIDMKLESTATYTYDIIDTHGRTLKSGNIRGLGHTTLDTSALPKGMYFINILNEEYSVAVHKFVKQ